MDTKRVYLREYKISDAKENAQVWNDKEIAKWIADAIYPATEEKHKKWIQNNKKRKDAIYNAILLKSTNQIIGTVWFNQMSESNNYQTAEICYVLGKKFRGNGYASEALNDFIRYGFSKLNLLKISAKINENNKNSINLVKQLGFKLEAKLKKQSFTRFPKKWSNELVFSLLKEDLKK